MAMIWEKVNKALPILLILGVGLAIIPIMGAYIGSVSYADLQDITFRFYKIKFRGYHPHYPPASRWGTSERVIYTPWQTITKTAYDDGTCGEDKVTPKFGVSLQPPTSPSLYYEGKIRGGKYKIWIWKLKFSVAISIQPYTKDGAWVGAYSDGVLQFDLYIEITGSRSYFLGWVQVKKIKIQGVTANDLHAKYGWWDWKIILDYQQHTKLYTPSTTGSYVEIYDKAGNKKDHPYPNTKDEINKYLAFPKLLRFKADLSPTVIKNNIRKYVAGKGSTLIYECVVYVASWSEIKPVTGEYETPDDPSAGMDISWFDKIWVKFRWLIITGIIIIVIVFILKIIGKALVPIPK